MPRNALEDRIAIQDVICAVTLNIDLGDAARAYDDYFTDDATLDYSSLHQGMSVTPVAQFREHARRLVSGFDATHQQVTNFDIKVDGDTATARSMVRATQRVGAAVGSNGGVFHHTLVRTESGWKITHLVYTVLFRDGQDTIGMARQRIAAREKEAAGRP